LKNNRFHFTVALDRCVDVCEINDTDNHKKLMEISKADNHGRENEQTSYLSVFMLSAGVYWESFWFG
jgi:hypothetical protein